VIGLVGALKLEQSDEWAVYRCYMPVQELATMRNDEGTVSKKPAQ